MTAIADQSDIAVWSAQGWGVAVFAICVLSAYLISRNNNRK